MEQSSDSASKNDTRKRLAAAALDCFSRHGYEAVGVQEIVEAAGITKPSLYHYFGSKQGLLEALVAEGGGTLAALYEAAAKYRHDLVMNLRGLLDETAGFAAANPAFFRLMTSLFSAAPETVSYNAGKELRRRLAASLTALFKAAAKDHGNMKGRERVYGETFLPLLQSCALLSLNGELKLDAHTRYRIIHQYMHGIFS
jgi:TetR/AcrR family transcriptional regulator